MTDQINTNLGDTSGTDETSNSVISPLTSREREAIIQQAEQAKQKLEQLNRDRQQVQRAVAVTARRLLAESEPADPEHMWLDAHGLSANYLRQLRGKLIAPMYSDGELVNLLSIRPDGVVRTLSGGRFNGGYVPFGHFADNKPIYLAADFITAAKLHEQTGCWVACSITASNLLAAGRSLQVVCPPAQIIIFNNGNENESARGYVRVAAKELGAEVWEPAHE